MPWWLVPEDEAASRKAGLRLRRDMPAECWGFVWGGGIGCGAEPWAIVLWTGGEGRDDIMLAGEGGGIMPADGCMPLWCMGKPPLAPGPIGMGAKGPVGE